MNAPAGTDVNSQEIVTITTVGSDVPLAAADHWYKITITFTTIKNTAGAYLVEVEGLIGLFMVEEKPVPVTPPAEIPPAEIPINWPALGGAIGGVIIVGAGIFFWVRRELSRHVTPQSQAPGSGGRAG